VVGGWWIVVGGWWLVGRVEILTAVGMIPRRAWRIRAEIGRSKRRTICSRAILECTSRTL
jgi:hypothetical protein